MSLLACAAQGITALKVHGEAHSTPALLELTVPGWEMAEWKTAWSALQGLSAPGEPPSQFFAQ